MVKLYFTCPVTHKQFSGEDYYIKDGYSIETSHDGTRKLTAKIMLHSGCPLCGEDHEFDAEEIGCPFENRQTNG